jgi:hypothetical protein
MQQRWERMLGAAERDVEKVRSSAYERGREDAMRGGGVPTEGRAQEMPGSTAPGSTQPGSTHETPGSPRRDMPH